MKTGAYALALLACAALPWGLAAPARASDLLTVNTTSAYVDPAVTGEFVTVPNLCLEPYGDQATTTGCDALGLRAVEAYQGTSPFGDNYFESATTPLATTNSFVPGNVGNAVNGTGYAPLFSDHKYDLFGRAGDRMGLLTRREILFMDSIPTTGNGITTGQTVPGEDTIQALVVAVLIQPEGATQFNLGGFTWQISDLPTYARVTGFSSGKLDTVNAFCDATLGPVICGVVPPEFRAQLYVALNFPDIVPQVCGTQQNGLQNLTNCKNRDEWMNQIVVGYVESWEALGGDAHFAENFRSQVGYAPLATVLDGTTEVLTDFRLEQSAELSGAFTTRASDPGDAITPGDNLDGIAGRQTFQQAFQALSESSIDGIVVDLGQMVSQDVNGYLMTCLNCEEPGASHAFAPQPEDLTFMPYQSGWDVVPTIVHAAP
jgi:hypothetical protein